MTTLVPFPTLSNNADIKDVIAAINQIARTRQQDTGLFNQLQNQLTPSASSLNNGTTGTGKLVLQTSPTITLPLISGVTDGSNASAGNIGEFISSNIASGSAVGLSNNVAANVTSISLTAGDWDVWGNIGFNAAASTVPVAYFAGINTVSATFPTDAGNGAAILESGQTFSAAASNILTAGFTRISSASSITAYLIAKAQFTTSTMSAYGFIGARRVR